MPSQTCSVMYPFWIDGIMDSPTKEGNVETFFNPVAMYFIYIIGIPAFVSCAVALWCERDFWFEGWL